VPRDGTGKIPQLGSAISALLAILESRLDRGELTLADPVVGLAREHIDKAVALGLDQGFRKRLESLLSGLAAPRLSRTPHVNGVLRSEEPEPPPPIIPVVERRRTQSPVAQDRRSGQEVRRFKRFVSPVLLVGIGGHAFRTMDWSIGGLLLAGSAGELAPGMEVPLKLMVETLRHAPFEDRAVLVRRDAADGWFSLRFKSGASATLKVLELLSRCRISPSEPAAH
jgi:hypothetical protein